MIQQIIIEGDLVRLVNIENQRVVPLREWLPLIERRVAVNVPVLPTATRGIYYDPTNNTHSLTVMLELPPKVINMNLRGREMYDLAVPWTQFIFFCTNQTPEVSQTWRLDDYRMLWSKTRYTDPNARDMIPALLPNIYEDGRICFGSTGVNANQSLADRLDQTVNEFYASQFNGDLTIRYPAPFRSHRSWQTATNRDAFCWNTWPDLDPNQTTRRIYSWNEVVNDWAGTPVDRITPLAAVDPIPAIPFGASFGRTEEWLATLTPAQRRRMIAAVTTLDPNEPVPAEPTTEDDDGDPV